MMADIWLPASFREGLETNAELHVIEIASGRETGK